MKIKRKDPPAARIEMLPLIDIVFLLLVFFIYAMLSMAVHRGMQVDLPESSQARPVKETELTVSITGDGDSMRIFLNTSPVTLAGLQQRLAERMEAASGAPPPGVQLFAEKTVSFQQLFRVLDVISKSGIHDVSLQARAEE